MFGVCSTTTTTTNPALLASIYCNNRDQ
jgi:hypothetical protein